MQPGAPAASRPAQREGELAAIPEPFLASANLGQWHLPLADAQERVADDGRLGRTLAVEVEVLQLAAAATVANVVWARRHHASGAGVLELHRGTAGEAPLRDDPRTHPVARRSTGHEHHQPFVTRHAIAAGGNAGYLDRDEVAHSLRSPWPRAARAHGDSSGRAPGAPGGPATPASAAAAEDAL